MPRQARLEVLAFVFAVDCLSSTVVSNIGTWVVELTWLLQLQYQRSWWKEAQNGQDPEPF